MKAYSFIILLLLYTQGRCIRQKRSVLTANERIINLNRDDSNVRISCNFYNTDIWISSHFLQNNISIANPKEVVFLNENSQIINGCQKNISGNFSTTFSRFAECSSTIANQDDCLVVSYHLCVVASVGAGPVRDIPTIVDFTCLLSRNLTTNTLSISPRLKKISLNNVLESGQFFTSFLRCTTSSCGTLIVFSNQVYSGDRIYVQLANGATTSLNLVLQTTHCWATNTSDSSTANSYNLIQSGCPLDTTNIYENFVGTRTRFSFEAFTWTNPQYENCFYIHCRVAYCVNDNGRNCSNQQTCSARKKRSTELGGEGEIISSGPITVLPKTCDKKSLGCSHDCKTDDEKRSFVCYCPSGYKLAQDRKTCQETNSPRSELLFSKKENLFYVERNSKFSQQMSIGLLGMILVILGALFWRIKKQTKESEPILKKERLI